ncbi:MAG: hypothetical protein PVG49_14635 [Desulfobacteraceae bacterium]|jgi:hypothetical protein
MEPLVAYQPLFLTMMSENYFVLNDRLLPSKVADLLFREEAGSADEVALVEREFSQFSPERDIQDLLEQSARNGLENPFPFDFIAGMVARMISNAGEGISRIRIGIYRGNKTFLYATYSHTLR